MSEQLNRIKRGIEELDQKVPGWRKKIDLDDLNMKWCSSCILGQLFGEYDIGLEYLGISDGDGDVDEEADNEAIRLGFQALIPEGNTRGMAREEYESLTLAWKKILEEGDGQT